MVSVRSLATGAELYNFLAYSQPVPGWGNIGLNISLLNLGEQIRTDERGNVQGSFSSYDMAGRTYRYFGGVPLYAFGHGLSYTTFKYSGLRTNTVSLSPKGSITVTVDITNTGKRAGDEVVQLYARHIGSKLTRANRDLRGFRRITLEPSQKRSVSFSVPASSLAWWNAATHAWEVEADTIAFEVGASSADIRATKKVRVKL